MLDGPPSFQDRIYEDRGYGSAIPPRYEDHGYGSAIPPRVARPLSPHRMLPPERYGPPLHAEPLRAGPPPFHGPEFRELPFHGPPMGPPLRGPPMHGPPMGPPYGPPMHGPPVHGPPLNGPPMRGPPMQQQPGPRPAPSQGQMGVTLKTRNDGLAIFAQVNPTGNAARHGVKAGDVLMTVNGSDLRATSLDNVSALLQRPETTGLDLGVFRYVKLTHDKELTAANQQYGTNPQTSQPQQGFNSPQQQQQGFNSPQRQNQPPMNDYTQSSPQPVGVLTGVQLN